MATAGLSLMGFMDQPQAIFHLRTTCVPADPSDAALLNEWHAAQRKLLGTAITNPGNPDIQPITGRDATYITQLLAQPWVQSAFQLFGYGAAEFKMVEVAPLLAFQFYVDTDRSHFHCNALKNPTVADLLPICLPQAQPKPLDLAPLIEQQAQSMVIKSRNLNVTALLAGPLGYNQNGYESIVAGVQIHVALPFVHVVRFNGRCYLHNGYHRAFGAAIAGATHIPCLLRDVATPAEAGIQVPGPIWQTFPLTLLESTNPPTMGHFIQGRAYDVQIRRLARILHITWAQYVMPDEYERMKP